MLFRAFQNLGAPQGAPWWDRGILWKERAGDARKDDSAARHHEQRQRLACENYFSSEDEGRMRLPELVAE